MIISIRTKIILGQVFLVSMVAVFIYTYYPAQQKDLAIRAINEKIRAIANIFSLGVGIGMGEIDFVAVGEALSWANSDSAVVYISVSSTRNEPITSFNPDKINVPATVLADNHNESFVESDRIIFYKSKISYQQLPMGTLIIGYSLKNLDASLKNLRLTTFYFCLAIFIVGVIISILIAHMISQNITRLNNAINNIIGGEKQVRVNIRSNDEMGRLGKAFNYMLDKLDASRKELVNYSIKLKKHNDELNQFSYVVSHDLKAPLRAIFKLSEWIEEDAAAILPDDSKKNLQTLRGRVSRMEALINGLLEYAKVGRHDVLSEKTDTYKLVKETIDLLGPPSGLSVNISQHLPSFKTKKILLQQVFNNLLSNAIKYSDKKEGRIDVSVKDMDQYYEFTIEDNGTGIDPLFHKKVFEIFQTLEARDKVEGTGIGLSIVKKSIEDVGGSISLESEIGKGSKFIFTWPKEIKADKKL